LKNKSFDFALHIIISNYMLEFARSRTKFFAQSTELARNISESMFERAFPFGKFDARGAVFAFHGVCIVWHGH
jgi:hypothetical protein